MDGRGEKRERRSVPPRAKDRLRGAVDTVLGRSLVPSYPVFVLTISQMADSEGPARPSAGSYGQYYEYIITKSLKDSAGREKLPVFIEFPARARIQDVLEEEQMDIGGGHRKPRGGGLCRFRRAPRRAGHSDNGPPRIRNPHRRESGSNSGTAMHITTSPPFTSPVTSIRRHVKKK